MTTGLFTALFLLAVVIFAALVYWSRNEADARSRETVRQILDAQKQDPAMQFLQRELANLREQMAKSMSDSAKLMTDSQKTVSERLDKAAEVVGNVQRS